MQRRYAANDVYAHYILFEALTRRYSGTLPVFNIATISHRTSTEITRPTIKSCLEDPDDYWQSSGEPVQHNNSEFKLNQVNPARHEGPRVLPLETIIEDLRWKQKKLEPVVEEGDDIIDSTKMKRLRYLVDK